MNRPAEATMLTLYFDGHCAVCVEEMRRLSRLDGRGRLGFINIRDDGFDPRSLGRTFAAMDARIHGRTRDGRWLIGVDCIEATYSAVGLSWLVWPLRLRHLKPMWDGIYQVLANNRHRLNRLLGYRKCGSDN